MSANLSKQVMLSHLHIRIWGATLTDRKVSAEVAKKHRVDSKRAGRYRKHVIDVKAPTYRAVMAAAVDLRVRHYFHTLPWQDDGGRILPAANFDAYAADQRLLRRKFDAAVAEFVADYPRLMAEAQRELKGLFDADDYPANIADRFGVQVSIMPLPSSDDFRADLPEQAVAEIKDGIEREIERTTQAAMYDPYKRLYEHIERMVERLGEPDNIFRDTLVTGLQELCAVLPGLNITQDPMLADLHARASKMIAGLQPQQLRENLKVRADVLAQANEIHDTMAAFMGAAQ